jgi:hypothetical protein
MGAWGPGLFSDDTACDVRDDYRELLEDGVDDDVATQTVLDSYSGALGDPDEGSVVWLALAFTQSKVGRLDPAVREEALRIIETGADLRRWADPAIRKRRQAALEKVRTQLVGPQPGRKRLRPPKRHETSLVPADVLAYRSSTADEVLLMRVRRIDFHRLSVSPIVRLLRFRGAEVPSDRVIRKVEDWPEPARAVALQSPRPPWSSLQWRVSAYKGDFSDSGFTVVTRTEPRRGDEAATASSLLDWAQLAQMLERNLREG